MKNKSPMVSIITPVYNSESFITETIKSIQAQTFDDFEILCIDDQSTDRSAEIIQDFKVFDDRIKYYSLPEKGGASIARNLGIREAKGMYIAFLDADDTWYPEKLEKQIKFMVNNDFDFTYTDYDIIRNKSDISNNIRVSPDSISYKELLIQNPIGCLTVMYNSSKIGLIQIPRIDKRNDYALWLQVLKKVDNGFRIPEVLSSYRISDNSLSNSGAKFKLFMYHYKLFNEVEDFGRLKSVFLSFRNALYYVRKRVLNKEKKNV